MKASKRNLGAIALLALSLVFTSWYFLPSKKKEKYIRVMFYNVENLYDTSDEEGIDDAEFLPKSELQWNEERLQTKLNHIAQVIQAVGGQNLPDVVGFAEIENRRVLDFLIQNTALKKSGYFVVHYDSPDKRGIDVALLYKKDRFTFLKSASYPVPMPGDSARPTRDILYVKGMLPNKANLHVVINHWPSRSGGAAETESKRLAAAKVAKRLCDSIQANEQNANVLLLGDFNDYPTNKSMREVLQAEIDTTIQSGNLFNLVAWQKGEGKGSHCYKGDWAFLDQIIASEALIKGSSGLQTFYNRAMAFRGDFLLTKNEKYGTMEPFRTYGGKNYLGGYSDHLPVFVDVILKEQ
jgi:predicted extracellular nuclease